MKSTKLFFTCFKKLKNLINNYYTVNNSEKIYFLKGVFLKINFHYTALNSTQAARKTHHQKRYNIPLESIKKPSLISFFKNDKMTLITHFTAHKLSSPTLSNISVF